MLTPDINFHRLTRAPTCRIADVEDCGPPGLTAQLAKGPVLHSELVVGHVQRLDLLGGRVSCDPFHLR